MTLVDRYVVVVFLRVFLICFVTLLGMYFVADFVNHLTELLRHGKTEGGVLQVLLAYYGPQVPWFFDLISRIAALIAAVFTVTWLQRNNEMAALMAAGISRWRIVKPLIVAVGVIAILAALNREFVIPRFGNALSRDARNLSGDQREALHPRYDYATNVFFDGKGIVPATRSIDQPKLRLPAELAKFGSQLAGERAEYRAATADYPSGFLISEITKPENVEAMHSLKLEEKTILFAPADTPWLDPGQIFVATELPFRQLKEGNSWRQFASTWDLIVGSKNPSLDYGADVSVTIHSRMVQPVLDVTLVFLGLPLVLARESRNAFISIGLCMIVVTIFMVGVLASQGLGMNYLIQPTLAAWFPLMVFVPAAYLISEPFRR